MELVFDPDAFDDLRYWVEKEHRTASKILKLADEILKNPSTGTGKPEPLKHSLSGCWSRRVDQKNRLVYKTEKNFVVILSCRYHYLEYLG